MPPPIPGLMLASPRSPHTHAPKHGTLPIHPSAPTLVWSLQHLICDTRAAPSPNSSLFFPDQRIANCPFPILVPIPSPVPNERQLCRLCFAAPAILQFTSVSVFDAIKTQLSPWVSICQHLTRVPDQPLVPAALRTCSISTLRTPN
jgi:hypothetical protein